jgi:hypothetical protein
MAHRGAHRRAQEAVGERNRIEPPATAEWKMFCGMKPSFGGLHMGSIQISWWVGLIWLVCTLGACVGPNRQIWRVCTVIVESEPILYTHTHTHTHRERERERTNRRDVGLGWTASGPVHCFIKSTESNDVPRHHGGCIRVQHCTASASSIHAPRRAPVRSPTSGENPLAKLLAPLRRQELVISWLHGKPVRDIADV